MKLTLAILFTILALVRAQFGGLGNLGGGSFGSSFGGGGGGNSFSFGTGGLDAPLQQAPRDPRANTGPVVFPPAPPDNGETSGVVVGASGFGFVPPSGGQSGRSRYYSFF